MLLKNMNLRKKLKLKLVLSIVLLSLGLISVLTIYYKTLDTGKFIYGFYFGLGFGLIGASIATIIKTIKLLKNKEKFKKAEIIYNDERNRFITNKTWSIACVIMLFLIYGAVIVSGVFNLIIFISLLSVLGVFAFVLLLVKIILNKLY